METQKKTKTFHYKAAQSTDATTTVQVLLADALCRAPKIKDRSQALDAGGEKIRFITLTRTHKGILCGVSATYTKGNNQAVVPMNEDATEVPLGQIAPPENEDGQRTEFVEGTVYFACFGNHLVVLQSIGFRTSQLEDYFNWLLKKDLPSNIQPPLVTLVDVPQLDLRKKAVKGVKSITLKAPVEFKVQTRNGGSTSDASIPGNEAENQQKAVVLHPTGLGLTWLESAMDSIHAGFSDGFTFKEALETGDIEVRLQVLYCKRSKDEGRVMLDDVAAALSHSDVEYEMDIPGVGKVSSDKMKIRDDFTVDAPGGLPDPSSVFNAMAQWLDSLLTGGMV